MEKVREFEDALLDKQREVDEATEHCREKSKYRFSPRPSVVPEDAHSAEHVSSDGMSHSGGQGDEDSEGGNWANVPQVRHNVGSSKRRCVVLVLEGVIPRGLPTVDVLAQGLSGYSQDDLNRLKEVLEEKLNDEATNSHFREVEEQERLRVEPLGSKGSQG